MKFIKDIAFVLLLVLGSLLSYLRWQGENLFPTLSGETGLPAWDWIVWSESPKGLTASQVYRVAMNTPGSGIQIGDVLKKVEYQSVPDHKLLSEIHFASAPGKILIYQIERDEANTFIPRKLNLFVFLSWKPFFSSADLPLIWNVQAVMGIVFGFLTLIIFLILYPLIRGSFQKNMPILLLLIFALIQFTWFSFRTLRIRLDFPANLIFQEQIFILAWSLLAILIGIMALVALPGKLQRIKIIPSMAVLISLAWVIPNCLFIREDFREHNANLFNYLVFISTVHSLWFVTSERESGPIKDLRWFRLLSIGGLTLLLTLSTLQLIGIHLFAGETALMETGFLISLFLPVLDLSASRLKFGKATVVLTRTIQYLLFSAAVFLVYLFSGWLLENLYPGAPYLEWINLLIVIITALSARAVYHRNKSRFSQLGISLQPRQTEEIQQFIAGIPRYTHSQDLIQDASKYLQNYFSAQSVQFWLEDQENNGEANAELKSHYISVFNSLSLPELYWSANKELSGLVLSESDENFLIENNWTITLPLRFSRAKAGLLLLSRKKKGVYNLEDLDLLRRISTQIWLTLDILYLLENEKLLMQKTMEANLTALRSQINPHFLFNTLNTIAALIHDSPEMAEMAVENLAFIFRYTLRTSGENFATVENEMGLVSKYLEIEKFRFGDNLEVIIEIEDSCKDLELPALVIQTIVENCIKHGITKIVTKGIVSIRIFEQGIFLKAVIEDNGPGIRSDRILKGTGLNNIHSRLHSLYDNPDILTFENTGNGTRVTLTLPKKRYEK
jgi:two-component system, LytTR family, sensor kinase